MCCAGRHLRADLFGARRVRSRRAPWAQHARVTEVAGMSYLTEDDVARLLALPRPDTAAMVDLDDSTRKAIENRVSALTALIEGAPVKPVAPHFGLQRKTCKRMLAIGKAQYREKE